MGLLGFPIDYMLAQFRVIFPQLKAVGVVSAVLFRQVHMRTLCAAHLDDDPRTFLGHLIYSFHNQ